MVDNLLDPDDKFWDPPGILESGWTLTLYRECPKCGSPWATKLLREGYRRPSGELLLGFEEDSGDLLVNLHSLKNLLVRSYGDCEGEHLICRCSCGHHLYLRPLDYKEEPTL